MERKTGYFFQFTKRSTGEVLLEGTVTGGNKQDCRNAAWTRFGWKNFINDDIKLYMKGV